MSDAGGRPRDLPYGLTYDQLLAITHAIRVLGEQADALKHTKGEEHALAGRHAAEVLDFQFPEIKRHFDRLVEDARRDIERKQQRSC